MASLYDRLDKNQKEVYDKIVEFGQAHSFSKEDIMRKLPTVAK